MRLGSKEDYHELKEHPFFATIDWVKLIHKELDPPIKPLLVSDGGGDDGDDDDDDDDDVVVVVVCCFCVVYMALICRMGQQILDILKLTIRKTATSPLLLPLKRIGYVVLENVSVETAGNRPSPTDTWETEEAVKNRH